ECDDAPQAFPVATFLPRGNVPRGSESNQAGPLRPAFADWTAQERAAEFRQPASTETARGCRVPDFRKPAPSRPSSGPGVGGPWTILSQRLLQLYPESHAP